MQPWLYAMNMDEHGPATQEWIHTRHRPSSAAQAKIATYCSFLNVHRAGCQDD